MLQLNIFQPHYAFKYFPEYFATKHSTKNVTSIVNFPFFSIKYFFIWFNSSYLDSNSRHYIYDLVQIFTQTHKHLK